MATAGKTIAFGEIQPTDPITSAQRGAVPPAAAAAALAAPSSLLNPIDYPQDWDFCTVGGVRSPGIIPKKGISGLDRVNKWDVKEGKGTKGATTTYVGRPPIPFSIKFWLWTSAHFQAWDAFASVLRYDPSKTSPGEAVSFFHPAAADPSIGVSSVVVTKIGGITEEDDHGLYSRTVDFLEYAPAAQEAAVSTPAGSKYTTGRGDPNAAPGTQPDPAIVALQKQAAALAKQAQGTA